MAIRLDLHCSAAFTTIMGLVLAALAGAAPAVAESTPAGDFSFKFTTDRPGAAAGLEFRQLYKHPEDPNAKPSAVRRFLFAAPEGSVLEGSAVPACNASDAELQQLAKGACPADTVVGSGYITVMTGLPGEQPLRADATVFNTGDGIIELFTDPATGLYLAMERPQYRGGNAFEDSDIAVTPGGPPDGYSAAREAYLKFPLRRGPGGKPFITTPTECPAGGRWTARFEWTNADGNGYANKDSVACRQGGSSSPLSTDLRMRGRTLVVFGKAPEPARVLVRMRRGSRTVARRLAHPRDGRYRVRFFPRRPGSFRADVVASTDDRRLHIRSRRLRVNID